MCLKLLVVILLATSQVVVAHPFCQTDSADAVFGYNNRVFVLNKATRRVFRLYKTSTNSWTSDDLDINQMFDGTLQDFDSGFSIDAEIFCAGSWDIYCEKKSFLYNVTILFFGHRYKSFRPKPNKMDFTPLTNDQVRQDLMPFNALAEGNINHLTLWRGHRNISAMAYHSPEQDLVVTSSNELRAGIVVTSTWRLRHDENWNYVHARGGFRVDGETYFLIRNVLWRLEKSDVVWEQYRLVPTRVAIKSFFGCDQIGETTTSTSTTTITTTTTSTSTTTPSTTREPDTTTRPTTSAQTTITTTTTQTIDTSTIEITTQQTDTTEEITSDFGSSESITDQITDESSAPDSSPSQTEPGSDSTETTLGNSNKSITNKPTSDFTPDQGPDWSTDVDSNPAEENTVNSVDSSSDEPSESSGFPVVLAIIVGALILAVVFGVAIALFIYKSKPSNQATVESPAATKKASLPEVKSTSSTMSSIFTINSMTGSTVKTNDGRDYKSDSKTQR